MYAVCLSSTLGNTKPRRIAYLLRRLTGRLLRSLAARVEVSLEGRLQLRASGTWILARGRTKVKGLLTSVVSKRLIASLS